MTPVGWSHMNRPSALQALAALGQLVRGYFARASYLAATAMAVVLLTARPTTWRRTVRDVLSRQILYTGVEATPFTVRLAFLIGISLVVQAQLWLTKVGQSNLLGPIMVAVLVRELGPLLSNMIVILRSGNAMAAEMGHMKMSGEVRVLDAQGIDPFLYLLVPRAIGMAISVFSLTVLFLAVSLFSGYLSGWFLGVTRVGPIEFLGEMAGAMEVRDIFNLIAKSVIPSMLAAIICCSEGLSVGYAITDVPKAVTRGVQRSVVVLFLVAVVISALTYLV